MQVQPHIVLTHANDREEAERLVRDRLERLGRYSDRITSCRVVVARPHRRHRHGNACEVRLELAVPGRDLIVRRAPALGDRQDLLVALREAFHAARRQLQDWAREQRGAVKTHERMPRDRARFGFGADGRASERGTDALP